MEKELEDMPPLDLVKHCLLYDGQTLNILCDSSFLRWYCVHEGKNILLSLNHLLDVDHYQIETTGCVQQTLKDWYRPDHHHKSLKVANRVTELKRKEGVCDHGEAKHEVECCESVLAWYPAEPHQYFFATMNPGFCKRIRKTGAPIITVRRDRLILLPPSRSERELMIRNLKHRILMDELLERGEIDGPEWATGDPNWVENTLKEREEMNATFKRARIESEERWLKTNGKGRKMRKRRVVWGFFKLSFRLLKRRMN